MKRILCFLGFHDWWTEVKNIAYPNKVLYRTFMRCRDCKKYGKLVFMKEVNL